MGLNKFPPRHCRWLLVLACACGPLSLALAGEVETLPPLIVQPRQPRLALEDAVRQALAFNPELAVFRQQRGLAAAQVVIARTYPFNPVFEARIVSDSGPAAAGILTSTAYDYRLGLELQVRGQGTYRRQAAQAGLSRTEWEIAAQEVLVASHAVKAFQEVIYRQAKLDLIQTRIRLNEEAANLVIRLRKQGKLTPADVILIQAEVADSRGQLAPGRLALDQARANLRLVLGTLDEGIPLDGTLETPTAPDNAQLLLETALARRPELRARTLAVNEAEALLRLEIADRFGNPTLGPVYGVDPTLIRTWGAQLTIPIPALNLHRGQIQLRQAERDKAALELRKTEIQVRQEVIAVLARLADARAWVYNYQSQLLPTQRKSLAFMEKLFAAGQPGVDVLRVISVRRDLLKAQDAYLDALWELSLARADLIAAIGDPTVVLGPPEPGPR